MGSALENMPLLLQQKIIGTTINYIILVEMADVPFITQDAIEEFFKKFAGASLNDAFRSIDATFKDYIDEYYSTYFKNCYPHGLARLSAINRSAHNVNIAPPRSAAVASAPSIKAINQPTTKTPATRRDEHKSVITSNKPSPLSSSSASKASNSIESSNFNNSKKRQQQKRRPSPFHQRSNDPTASTTKSQRTFFSRTAKQASAANAFSNKVKSPM